MITLCKDCDQFTGEECGDTGVPVDGDNYCGDCSEKECKTCPYDECPLPINERPYKNKQQISRFLCRWFINSKSRDERF